MKIFNFELEEKLDQHFSVKFNGESYNGDIPEDNFHLWSHMGSVLGPPMWPLFTPYGT